MGDAESAFEALERQLLAVTVAWTNYDEQTRAADKRGEARNAPQSDEARPEVVFVHIAVEAIINFVNGIPVWREANLAMPLERLLIAITHLESGKGIGWLKPRRGENDGRPGVSFDQASRRGQYVWVINYLIGRGSSVGEAAKIAFRASPSGFIEQLLDGTRTYLPKISPKTLLRWRDDLTSRPPPSGRITMAPCAQAILRDRIS
jgi:hypothetical protein